MDLFRRLVWLLARVVLSLRYRVELHGAEKLRDLRGPLLILPNHPGFIDPALVLTTLWPYLHPRPVLFEGNFQTPLLGFMARLLRAVPIPDLTQASREARARTEQALQEVIAGLRRGDNFLLWPAGHVERDGAEHLGGARAAADLLAAVPEARVVLVHTRGVWGSTFSYAYTGKAPRLLALLRDGILTLLANLLLFTPRRKVSITAEPVERSRLPEPRRETLNPWLEGWYNRLGPETPTFVPYHFLFGPRQREFPRPVGLAEVNLAQIRPETRSAVAQVLADKLKRPLSAEEQKPETTLDQLGLDSLDRMEVTLAIEQQFGFHGDEVPRTVGQLWALAQGLVEREPPKPAPPEWFRPPSDDGSLEALGETVPEAFVARALACRKDVATADDLSGVLTYERLLIGTLTLARRLAALPGENVGLLLPASVACDVAFLALHLAGKLPVLLNWTTGPANLAHVAQLLKVKHVITSKTFLDRLGVNVEGIEYVYLESLRKQVGRWELLRTLVEVRFFPGRVRGRVPVGDAQRPAVVLFTSGSERAPKAVPLTHANLIAELRYGTEAMRFTRRVVILGFLPAFHSFGIAVTSLLPLLGGMRVVHHPDPTDASRLARKIASWKPTLLVGTPTFVSYIVERAQPGELDSLRLIVVGAEKCPASLYERCAAKAPDAVLLEGYGITECSPVVAVNRPEKNRPGTVGPPLSCLEVRAVDLETEAEMPSGQMGMLWVSGPTVFPGYFGYEGPSPFRDHAGRRWYVTGDLVTIGEDKVITLAGRLKRFLKAGGEMISLPALEEPFARRSPPDDEGPRVAVEGIETDGGRRIVLFTRDPMPLGEANAFLQQQGFRGVMRLDEVRQVESIPLLGTGKVDYKALRAQLEKEAGR